MIGDPGTPRRSLTPGRKVEKKIRDAADAGRIDPEAQARVMSACRTPERQARLPRQITEVNEASWGGRQAGGRRRRRQARVGGRAAQAVAKYAAAAQAVAKMVWRKTAVAKKAVAA